MRILERPHVPDLVRVEDRYVRHTPDGDAAVLAQPQPRGGHAGHLVHRLLQRQHMLVTNVVAEYARKGSVVPWMRHAVADPRETSVAGDHRHRMRHDAPDVSF